MFVCRVSKIQLDGQDLECRPWSRWKENGPWNMVILFLCFVGKKWALEYGNPLYVPETHIMYFIRRCWFLKSSEEIHYVPIGPGDMWYYVPLDDGWKEVLGRNVYNTSQYFSPNAKYWTASSGNRTRAPPDRMWTLYHWAMESVHNMGVLAIHYVPVLLSKCQILNWFVRESNSGPPLIECGRSTIELWKLYIIWVC